MSAYAAGWTHQTLELGLSRALRLGKHILNRLAGPARVAADHSRFAALPARYLDDVGMTEGERSAALGYEEPTTDGWRLIASHL
jgi:hypothetical protein